MANRKLYNLTFIDNKKVNVHKNKKCLCTVFENTIMFYVHYRNIPMYIIRECKRIIIASEFELNRGYTLGGYSCRVNNRSIEL